MYSFFKVARAGSALSCGELNEGRERKRKATKSGCDGWKATNVVHGKEESMEVGNNMEAAAAAMMMTNRKGKQKAFKGKQNYAFAIHSLAFHPSLASSPITCLIHCSRQMVTALFNEQLMPYYYRQRMNVDERR